MNIFWSDRPRQEREQANAMREQDAGRAAEMQAIVRQLNAAKTIDDLRPIIVWLVTRAIKDGKE